MSVVTGLVLVCSKQDYDEDIIVGNLDPINRWLTERASQELVQPSQHATGGKHPQLSLFAAGYNHFPEDEFIAFLHTLDRWYPENVVLTLTPEKGRRASFSPCTIRRTSTTTLERSRRDTA